MKKILISTGGSGGHVLPAISIFQHLQDNYKVSLITDRRGSTFINNKDYEYQILDVPNIFSNLIKFPLNLILFIFSIIKYLKYLSKNNIEILFSTGGYMSFPACIAAKILNVKIFLFEPNMIIGRANKIFLKYSNKIICYNEQIIGIPNKYRNKIYVINPLLRKDIYKVNKNLNYFITEPIKIIVLGGSQGARFFDDEVKNLILHLSKYKKINLYQQVYDEKKIQEYNKIYSENNIENKLFKFDEKLIEKLNFYDLAITRSGSSAISELCQLNIPFIAIPFPFAKDNHQFHNAKYYKDKNSCWLISQNEFDIKKTTELIMNLITNKLEYENIKKNLNKISLNNTWNNINEKLKELINEN